MRVVGVSGSPRRGGNTDTLVRRALDLCEKKGAGVEFIPLSGKKIEYCEGCFSCKRNGCIKEDDVRSILDSMEKADALIIGSPTYFSSVSGKLKSLFDRSLPLRSRDYRLRNKIGGAIAVGGSRNGGQEFTIRDIHNWMLLQEMIVVADRETAHFGGICVGRDPADVLKDQAGLRTVDNLALRVLDVAVKHRG
ncbi:MAG: flavodoxin family protein [Candidatus Altiarchaeota archaeon]|nr:flavodoxin family protein [Candidatus Altiarchaeota archaeon]